ncbi:MAG: thiol reductase thioredoxin [Pseudoalteromonas sp.]|nr:thiol reductase thioredoxin [Pseudoalteromonas sp.]|tara:strand:+ start:1299 stop:1682 length:384 start_codon:yes stop_codon:yes gene_type:complete
MKYIFTSLISLFMAFSASAFEKQPFNEVLFSELQAQNAVIMIDVYAPWCPTCKKQQKLFQQYHEQNPDKPFHVLVVDYDNDKQWVKKFRAPRQSTLLLYKGDKQFWYSVAETRFNVIEEKLNSAFKF